VSLRDFLACVDAVEAAMRARYGARFCDAATALCVGAIGCHEAEA
jgi:hypothetical protein